MGWFVPRNLASIKFGGTQLVPEGDLLPKPTVLLFETKDVSTDASVLPLSSLKLQDFDRPFLECSHYEPCRSGLEAYRKLTAPGALKPAYALKIDATSVKGWNWMPGDALGILCQNDPCVVEYALKRLEIDPNAAYSLTVVGEAPKESCRC